MGFKVRFSKQRHKFSAAHFTLFGNGEVERLHGHNYAVSVALSGETLKGGLLFPFHQAKLEIERICEGWDERILLPARSDWVLIKLNEKQYEVNLKTPLRAKFYSLPREDVVLLECDNISSENLALLFASLLKSRLETVLGWVPLLEVTIGESPGQAVTYRADA